MNTSIPKQTGLIYITGIGGTGKSSLQKRLVERGYESIDGDHGYCAFYNKRTGEAIVSPAREMRTPEWLEAHEWCFIPGKLDELQARSQNQLIFLCGTATDEADHQHHFAKVFALIADDATIAHRLRTRPGEHAYGKSEHELELTLVENAEAADRYAKLGADIIDATKPLDNIIDEILRAIEP